MTFDAKNPVMRAASNPRVLSSWTRVLLDALNDRGIDGYKMAMDCGLDRSALDNPNASLNIEQTSMFWSAAVEATGDDALGLSVSRFVKPTSFHALGLATLASPTLLDAYRRMERYSEIISDAEIFRVQLQQGQCVCYIEHRNSLQKASATSLDAIISQIIRFSKYASANYRPPRSLSLMRPQPRNLEAFQEFFLCPLTFGAKQNAIVFDKGFVEQPLSSANETLARQHDQISAQFIQNVRSNPFAAKLREAMIIQLPSGDAGIITLAGSMGVSVRALQRTCADFGQSYSEFLSALREELARHYLSATHLSITEIGFLLGYGDTSSFSRAFKGWTGISPTQFQDKL